MTNELQQYIPYPSYKFLGKPGVQQFPSNNDGYWENRNRYGLMGVMGLRGLGYGLGTDYSGSGCYDVSGALVYVPLPGATCDLGTLPYTGDPLLQTTPSPTPVTNPVVVGPVVGPSGPGAPITELPTGYCSDPGFMSGLMSWFDPATIANFFQNDLADVEDATVWACAPMMNVGIIALPLALVGMLLFAGGRASKRSR